MEDRYLHFITLLSDDPDKDILDEFAADLEKADRITEVLQKENPSVSFQEKLLWDIPQGAHEKLIDDQLKVLYSKPQLKNSKKPIAIEKILWREERTSGKRALFRSRRRILFLYGLSSGNL